MYVKRGCCKWVRVSPLPLKFNSMIKKLDKLAQEIFGEFGFDTCTLEQQLIIIKLNTNDR